MRDPERPARGCTSTHSADDAQTNHYVRGRTTATSWVWIGDSGVKPYAGQPVGVDYPLWSNTVAAIEPGESVNVCVVARHDPSPAKPTVSATWPSLAGRRWAGSRTVSFGFATTREVEHGMPGQTGLGGA
jgi:hypothetical protein